MAGYMAVLFSLLSIAAGGYVAARLAALAADETSGHSVLLYALPVSRGRVPAAATVVATAGMLLFLVVAGLATWLGTNAVGAPLGAGAAVPGALNGAPVAFLCLGAAVLALGWAPRAVLAFGLTPAVRGFLLQVLAQSMGAPGWVRDISPFAHLAAVPDVPAHWSGTRRGHFRVGGGAAFR